MRHHVPGRHNRRHQATTFASQGFRVVLHAPTPEGNVRFAVFRSVRDGHEDSSALLGSGTRNNSELAREAAERMVRLIAGRV